MADTLTELDRRQLKNATRELLGKYDGLQEASRYCRAGATQLSQYQNYDAEPFVPIDVVVALERQLGDPVISAVVSELSGAEWSMPEGDAVREVMDLSPAVGELIAFIRDAAKKDSPAGVRFSEFEKRKYLEIRARMNKELREVDLAVEGNRPLPLASVRTEGKPDE